MLKSRDTVIIYLANMYCMPTIQNCLRSGSSTPSSSLILLPVLPISKVANTCSSAFAFLGLSDKS